VHDMENKNQNTPYASKLLRKGVVFKDNTLYSPIKVSCFGVVVWNMLTGTLSQYFDSFFLNKFTAGSLARRGGNPSEAGR
jgi:hypothetical protein